MWSRMLSAIGKGGFRRFYPCWDLGLDRSRNEFKNLEKFRGRLIFFGLQFLQFLSPPASPALVKGTVSDRHACLDCVTLLSQRRAAELITVDRVCELCSSS